MVLMTEATELNRRKGVLELTDCGGWLEQPYGGPSASVKQSSSPAGGQGTELGGLCPDLG